MLIEEFNALPAPDAVARVRVCADIPAWASAVVARRPFPDAAALQESAGRLAGAWTEADVDQALADHPRIGERPAGGGASAGHSQSEQSGVDSSDAELARRLREGNAVYEARFGRIYLVRAKGRSGPELADLLEQRLANDPATEAAVTRTELQQIALLRLAELVP